MFKSPAKIFFDVLSFAESNFSQNFSNAVLSPFGGLYITLNKVFLSFLWCISIQSDSTLFEFIDRSVGGLRFLWAKNMLNPPPLPGYLT